MARRSSAAGSGLALRARSALRNPRLPLILLVVVSALGVAARAYRLGTPAARSAGGGYVFDERYYVSAARIIAGKATLLGDVYAGTAPAGSDPNGEHPQLGKVFIAAGLSATGDEASGWRISAVIFGAAAILLLFWLVRCAGGSRWLGLGAAALASADNLWLVHSRIAVLDIYVLPFMLAGAAFYVRRQPLVAGALIGVGCCVKEFAAYTLLVVALLELFRWAASWYERRRPNARWNSSPDSSSRARPLLSPVIAALVAGATFLTLLAVLDAAVPPYSGGKRVDRGQLALCSDLLIWKGACNHLTFMARYAARLRGGGQPGSIAAAPTDFWLDRKPITYFRSVRASSRASARTRSVQTTVWYRGEINRVLLFTGWLALVVNLWWALRRRDRLSLLIVAWVVGTWLPAELFHVLDGRTTYLYYMVVTMPGIYLAVARLLAIRRIPRLLVVAWTAALLWDFVNLYPLRTLGHG